MSGLARVNILIPPDRKRDAMAYATTNDVGIDEATYKAMQAQVGPEVPTGLIVHMAIKRPEGGLRYIDVWESEEDRQRFEDERLHPVVHRMVRQRLGLVRRSGATRTRDGASRGYSRHRQRR
jgi:hypothetical protein